MSTRGIISLQKGNRVRYCYVHNDSDQLYRSILEMKFNEIEATFDGMAVLDGAKIRPPKVQSICGMSRLVSDREFKEWVAYSIARDLREKHTKKFLKPYQKMKVFGPDRQTIFTGLDYYIYMRVKSMLCGQNTANIPYILNTASYNGDDCGSFLTDQSVITQADAINHKRPYASCENICYYNLDTHELKQWSGGDLTVDLLKNGVKRRKPSPFPKLNGGFKLTKTEIKNLFKKYVG